jgi:hypothetical protein
MGIRNSSITRVWPVFDLLFAEDSSGKTWLPGLIHLAPNKKLATQLTAQLSSLLPKLAKLGREIPANLLRELSPAQADALGSLRHAFEVSLPPPIKFLTWLIRNPDRLSWPDEKSQHWLKMSPATREHRSLLKQRCPTKIREALQLLREMGAAGSFNKWWTLEGRTSVDCRLETKELLLLIEGKRTEDVSSNTQMVTTRDQVVRNLEVAAADAARTKKQFAVLLCAEENMELRGGALEQSLPHLSPRQREALAERFLGCITWEQIRSALCPQVTLPDQIGDAVDLCLWARRQ